MTVLRSREISSAINSQYSSPTLKQEATLEPLTPAKIAEHSKLDGDSALSSASSSPLGLGSDSVSVSGTTRRRSLRLASVPIASQSTPSVVVSYRKRKGLANVNLLKNDDGLEAVAENRASRVRVSNRIITKNGVSGEVVTMMSEEKLDLNAPTSVVDGSDGGALNLRSGRKVVKGRKEGHGNPVHVNVMGNEGKASEVINVESDEEDTSAEIAVSGTIHLPGSIGLEESDKGQIVDGGRAIGTGVKSRRRHGKEEKGKGKVVEDGLLSDSNVVTFTASLLDNVGHTELDKEPMTNENPAAKARRTLSWKDKGKGKVVEDGSLSNSVNTLDLSLRLGVGNSMDEAFSSSLSLAGDERDAMVINTTATDTRGRENKERFRDIARKNASRFAHFSSQEAEENHVSDQVESEMTRMEADEEMEEWPGPFSTAMRIIKDRESNVHMAQQSSCLNRSKSGSIRWVPKKEKPLHCSKQSIPQLQDLCLDILAKNADAVTSLESVPDLLRHKLSQMLCDSRKMNCHFLDLLVDGFPTEIRVRDCSWLTEEQFTRTFKKCEASQLMVLQLDQCGRCLPDYVLFATLARAPNALPALIAISMKGACRLSDAGLSALVASAPALRSINLGQCSLLTSDGINTLADSLGSVLRELYMDDCQNIEPMHILPALLKLEHLEVLSLAGIQTVSDVFISRLVAERGQNFKELVLTDCTKLTDSSFKVIAETCTGLCALDMSNLRRLTDSTFGFLANGCRAIERLKLCRNAFSDEAIAAYLEASGESLKELSLNNVNKVGDNTAMSLARRSRKLVSLDLSWCRNLTDETLGLIVDSCLSLKVLRLFGCTQITNVFLDGHSNPQVQIIGLKMTPILKHLNVFDPQQGPLGYSSVSS